MSGYIGNVPTPQATQSRDSFTATAGQTSFATSGYSAGGQFLDVHLNGVKLQDTEDYTATNGSDVVLTVGAGAGDTLEVVSFSTFEVADVYTRAETYSKVEADAEFVSDPNGAVTVDGSGNVGIGSASFLYPAAGRGLVEVNGSSSALIALKAGNASKSYWFSDGTDVEFLANGGALKFGSGTGGAERMRIDASGRVTMPYQPAFRAYQFIPRTGVGTIVYSQTGHNIGSHYNTATGIFTAPIAGVYHFDFSILMKADASVAYIRVLFKVNGSTATTFGDTLTGGAAGVFTSWSYHAPSMSHSFYLNANDTVEVHNDSAYSTYSTGGYGSFSGYLVG